MNHIIMTHIFCFICSQNTDQKVSEQNGGYKKDLYVVP